uniref:Nudix hydrolase domain-containing protein n=1 Tax=Strigamia maritima TaxID=126957 RepID=T1IML6_STRMM
MSGATFVLTLDAILTYLYKLEEKIKNMLKQQLGNYNPENQEEIDAKTRILEFLDTREQPFSREQKDGHITGSAFLLNSDSTKFLLMHHAKLDKWLQPGGHCDGETDVLSVALREAKEESGISNIEPVSREIFDLDVHLIPENAHEAAHYHYDVRFLLKTIYNDLFDKNSESKALKWMDFSSYQSEGMILDSSVVRMIDKFVKMM